MLNFIISRSGGGKTTYVMDLIDSLAKKGKESILIVPEQFTFTVEKSLILHSGEQIASKADVLSFTALAERITDDSSDRTRPMLSQSAAGVIMSLALNDVKDKLKVYGKHASNKNASIEFVSLISEFKQNAISSDDIKNAVEMMPDSLLKSKLCDIELIMRTYDERINTSFFNPDDLLTQLEKTAELDTYIKHKTVFIDSFRGFTAQEYNIIEHFLKYDDDVYVTLCSYYEGNKYSSHFNITEPFSKTKRTAEKLISLAEKSGVNHPVPGSNKNLIFTNKEDRYASPELEHLEKSFALDTEDAFEDKCKNIILCRAPDIYSECAFVAATAKKLLREKRLRCRDIAIIARKIDNYEKPLKSALKKCGIPVYEDFRKPVDASPVINTVTSALAAAAGNFDNDSMMRYIKSGLIGLSSEEAALIENYCFVWNIRGRKWLDEWKSNPDGFGEVNKREEILLEKINSIRKRIILPVLELKKKIDKETGGEDAIKAVWEFIENINLRERIKDAAENMIANGEEGQAFELERMWDILVKSLDELVCVLKEETLSMRKISDALDIMLRSQTIGSLPQGLDEIVIGSADRMRIISPRIAFIIGANEGVFPPDSAIVSALTMKDRNKMAKFGIELSDSPEWKIADENLIAYSSINCPREFLAVSCSDSSADGSAINPGPFYKKIRNIFPNIKEINTQQLRHTYFAEGLLPAFEEFAKSEESEFRETIAEYFKEKPEFKGKIKALEKTAGIRDFRIEDKDTAKALYGKFRLSASQIEKFYKCPFSYFCSYGLSLKKIDEAKLDSMQIGNITHKVLEELLKNPGVDELINESDSKIKDRISVLAEKYIKEKTQDGIDSERFKYRINVIKRVILDIIKRICDEFAQSEFRPLDFELKIGGADIPAYKPDGAEFDISITGYVDRVDIAESRITGKKYFRIVDYKSGSKEFKLSDILHGINLQMLIYMFALEKKEAAKYQGFEPAGVLYYKAKSPIINEGDNKNVVESTRMEGVVLENDNVIRMMESDAEGKYINVSIKDGKISGMVLTEDEFDIIKCKTDFFINEMVNSLLSGNISAVPKVRKSGSNEFSPCIYCEFKSVCRYDDEIEKATYTVRNDKEERASLHEEVNSGE